MLFILKRLQRCFILLAFLFCSILSVSAEEVPVASDSVFDNGITIEGNGSSENGGGVNMIQILQ